MSREFNGSTSYILGSTLPIALSPPVTLVCQFMTFNRATSWRLFGVGVTSSSEAFFISNDATNFRLRANANDGSSTSFATSLNSAPVVNDTWMHAAAIYYANNNRSMMVNGFAKGSSATNRVVSDVDTIVMGANSNATISPSFTGIIAEVGVYNVALTDEEVAILATDLSPISLRPENLVAYIPLVRDVKDIINGTSFTEVDTIVRNHPRSFQ